MVRYKTLEPSPTSDHLAIEHGTNEDSFEVYVKNTAVVTPEKRAETDDIVVFELVENRRWGAVLDLLQKKEKLASLPIQSDSPVFSNKTAGNLLLHQVCRNFPPLEVIDCLLEANPSAIFDAGNCGFLPLHYACKSGTSVKVIQRLLEAYPSAIKVREDKDFMLPLHIAARRQASDEVLEQLLAHYPEATLVHDGRGNTPRYYAQRVKSPISKYEIMNVLDKGPMLMSTARATSAILEEEFGKRIKGLEDGYTYYIEAMKTNHDEEIGRITSDLLDVEFDKMTLKENMEESKAKMELLENDFATKMEKLGKKQEKFLLMQENTRLEGVELETKYEEKIDKVSEELADKSQKEYWFQVELASKSNHIGQLETQSENKELLHKTIFEAEHNHFNGVYTERRRREEDLVNKIEAQKKNNELKDRLIKRITGMAQEQRQKDNETIAELERKLKEQAEQLAEMQSTLDIVQLMDSK